MSLRIKPLILLLAVVLSACSSLDSLIPESKKIDYKSAAKKTNNLEIPPDLTTPGRDDRYLVPDVAGARGGSATMSGYQAGKAPEVRERSGTVLPQPDVKMQVVRDGNQRWLEVSGTPEKLWPQIKEFWQELGFIIAIERPEAGVMETDWAEDRAKLGDGFIRQALGKYLDAIYSTSERDKFRTRLEPGQTPGTVDVFVSHRGMSEVYITEGKDQTRWQPRDPDPNLEAEMLRRLMVRLGDDEKVASAAIASADKNMALRARLIDQNGQQNLQVDEKFDRAWRRVGLALDRVGFTVEDRDRVNGLYFVRYVDPEVDVDKKDDGWLSKLAFWRSGKKPDPTIQYRILVKEQSDGNTSLIQVLSKEGGADQSETSRKILSLLNDQLK